MNQVGTRVYYDKADGQILVLESEMAGDVIDRKEVKEVGIVDIPYGALNGKVINKVDVETRELILEDFVVEESPKDKHIRELEDELLLKEEAEIGGLL